MPNKKKATDDQIIEAYRKHGSVWKAAAELGMCGQSVQERLDRLGIDRSNRPITSDEEKIIIEFYQRGFARGDGRLKALASALKRTPQLIARKAKELGLTDRHRHLDQEYAAGIGENIRQWIKDKGHPRGATGLKHTPDALAIISAKSKQAWSAMTAEQLIIRSQKILNTRFARYGTRAGTGGRGSWKASWQDIGGKRHYYRSKWEVNYARYLEWMKQKGQIKDWDPEPEVFWFEAIKRGTRSYLPDFRVTDNDGSQRYVEVKGWMDSRSRTTIKRMAKYHPKVKLEVVDKDAYKQLKQMGALFGFED